MLKNGFSFIEILFVLIIIAILVAIAIPSYQDSITKAKRTDAKIALFDLANKLEYYYRQHHTYATATIAQQNINDVLSKKETAQGFYQLKIIAQTETTYLIQADPMLGKLKDDYCGALQLSEIGEKSISGKGDLAKCWL